LGSEIASWGSLLDRTAEFAPVFAYDRPGIGGSPPSDYRPTPLNVASQLRRLLLEAGIKPPFVLVGFSLGGVYVRTYAALHQDDVAGLVYIEPLDFTETRDETLATFVEAGLGEAEMREYDEALDHFGRENRSPPVIAEWEELRTLVLDSFAQYSQVAPAPQVPQVLLASAKADTPFARMSFEFDVWEKISSRHRLARQLKWILSVPDGHFSATTSSPPKIHGNDQDLVLWAIRRLVFPDIAMRLRRMIDNGSSDSVPAEFRRSRATYPVSSVSDDALNQLGYELLYLGRVEDALLVFKLNVEEFPDAWNPHDSLGEAHAAHGDIELAIHNYRRSLDLNPQNTNAVVRLTELESRLAKSKGFRNSAA